MSYFLKITREAREDLSVAYNWYEKQQSGLGEKLLEEVYKTQATIVQHPLSFRKRYKNIRTLLIKRFPYLIVYRVIENEIEIISYFHASRKPNIWKKWAF